MSIESILAEELDGYHSLILGTNLFIGPERPMSAFIPEDAVFILQYGSDPKVRMFQRFLEIRYHNIQVLVRASEDNRDAAQLLANEIHDFYDRMNINVDGYTEEDGYVTYLGYTVLTEQSSPIPLGKDTNNSHIYTLNLQVKDITSLNAPAAGESPTMSISVLFPLLLEAGVISMPQASAGQDGYLSAADFSAFVAGGLDTFNKSFSFNGTSSNQFLYNELAPSNLVPFVVPYDCTLLGYSAATASPFSLQVRVNGLTVDTIAVTDGASDYSLDVDIDDGQAVSLFADTASDVCINMFFGRRN